jgi:predicted component of type VI protein secretion system
MRLARCVTGYHVTTSRVSNGETIRGFTSEWLAQLVTVETNERENVDSVLRLPAALIACRNIAGDQGTYSASAIL